jgi:uncharacterized protein YjiS (DUF1127 family)
MDRSDARAGASGVLRCSSPSRKSRDRHPGLVKIGEAAAKSTRLADAVTEIGWPTLKRRCLSRAHHLSTGEAVSAGFGSKCERLIRIACRPWMTADVRAASRQAPAGSRKHPRSLFRIINIAAQLWSMLRRANERNRLAQLSSREWRDLGEDRVREELNKWPWQS